MVIFQDVSGRDLADDTLHQSYLNSLAAPMDGMWLTFAQTGSRREILVDGRLAGFYALGPDGEMLQLYVDGPFMPRATELFGAALRHDGVEVALVSTADPFFLGLALDRRGRVAPHSLLFVDHGPGDTPWRGISAAEGQEPRLRPAEADEMESLARLQEDALGQELGDWLRGYLDGLISRHELFVLELGDEVIATGEIRVADLQPPFADLGIITMSPYRRRGVASYLLGRLKTLCDARGLKPICSTTMENVGARRAIERAGFFALHRLLRVELEPGGS